jgi:hypothetical protein
MPKLIYTLRCAACYKSTVLAEYDANIHNTLQLILNIDLSEAAWSQATLPVASGGLGVRLATDLALPAFLISRPCWNRPLCPETMARDPTA